ncbi:transposase [Spirillospora sp. NPDC047418]
MPPPHPPEFRRRAVELARTGDKSVSALAKSLGISQSCLSNWIRQAAIEDRDLDGLGASEKKELAELRRKARATAKGCGTHDTTPPSPPGSAATGRSRRCTTSVMSPTARRPPRSASATDPQSWPLCATSPSAS